MGLFILLLFIFYSSSLFFFFFFEYPFIDTSIDGYDICNTLIVHHASFRFTHSYLYIYIYIYIYFILLFCPCTCPCPYSYVIVQSWDSFGTVCLEVEGRGKGRILAFFPCMHMIGYSIEYGGTKPGVLSQAKLL